MSKLKKALDKAKEDRKSDGQNSIQYSQRKPSKNKFLSENATIQRKDVSVIYSETKVKKINPQVIEKSKLISLSGDKKSSGLVKTLRTQIINKLNEIGGNTLLVTSANPLEGKTFVTINLGISIAQELDKTVLIVDADLATQSNSHRDFTRDFFGIEIDKGLCNYLLDSPDLSEIIINPSIPKLTFLPAGNCVPNSAELLGSPKMENLIDELRNRYYADRYIIIDSPSILQSADALVLSKYVDGILIVIEEGKTSESDLINVMELLKNRPVIGTVLNKSRSLRN